MEKTLSSETLREVTITIKLRTRAKGQDQNPVRTVLITPTFERELE